MSSSSVCQINSNQIYKKSFVKKNWLLIDASDMVLGRLAASVSMMLKGKHKPTYAPNVDCGDNIIIINAEKVYLSGKKMDRKLGKIYYRHTGYPGGIKSTTAHDLINGKFPEKVIRLAVLGMLKKTTLRNRIMKHLYIYKGPTHPHEGQTPQVCDLQKVNEKNKKR